MSLLFGRWNFDGTAVDSEYIQKVRTMLGTRAPDRITTCVKGPFVMLYAALDVTEESRREQQPAISPARAFLTWDGRLDNRTELIRRTGSLGSDCTDLQLVATCWDREGARCLDRLLGDWALSVLDYYERTLTLAKDFLGSRPLYYLRTDRYVAWSSLLDPLVLLSDERFTLCEEYLAGWLAGFPEPHLTPYMRILAVPPASFVRITRHAAITTGYFEFHPQAALRSKSDAEYEERFRGLFFQAVRRRLCCRSPVIAELSGGMDSSSIVCVADRLAATEGLRSVETVSFFDDTEPNWNEQPYFAAVEAQRNHTGFHVCVAANGRFVPERDGSFPMTPAHGARPSEAQAELSRFLAEGGFRVLLSGVGGDEFTGGVPTGMPELADLLSRGYFKEFLHRAFLWAIASHKPLIHVIGRTIRPFLPVLWVGPSAKPWPMPWLSLGFTMRNQRTFRTRTTRFRWFGPLPTFHENLRVLEAIRRQVASAERAPLSGCEKRYPFLDRDLLEFLFSVPREQLVRPGERRSLLRRALRGIVPDLVLNRSRKAFVVTGHLKALAADWDRVVALTEGMVLESRGVVDPAALRRTLKEARHGGDVPLLPAMRALRLEWWLRDSCVDRLFDIGPCGNREALLFESCVAAPSVNSRNRVSQLGNTKTERR